MAYNEFAEVVARYPILEKWRSNELDVTSHLIFYAEAELNGRLAQQFTIPFSPAPPVIKDLAGQYTYLHALQTRGKGEDAKAFREQLEARIKRILDGEEFIYSGSGTTFEAADSSSGIWSSNENYHPVHSMLDAENSKTVIDPDRLDAEESERP